MERKIGEQFKHYGVTLEVVKHLGCEGCYFIDLECNEYFYNTGYCGYLVRSDKQSVIFKKVTK